MNRKSYANLGMEIFAVILGAVIISSALILFLTYYIDLLVLIIQMIVGTLCLLTGGIMLWKRYNRKRR